MPSTTPAQGFRVPISSDDPDVVDDMTQLAKGIEKRVMGVYASTSDRDTKTAAAGVEEGMFAFVKDTNTIYYYDGSAWVIWSGPKITSGTASPSGGSDGDVYFKV